MKFAEIEVGKMQGKICGEMIKQERREKKCGNTLRAVLLVLAFVFAAGGAPGCRTAEAAAMHYADKEVGAVQEARQSSGAPRRYAYTDGSGRYMVKNGTKWYLYDRNGQPLSGVQYVSLEKKGRRQLERGYYYFGANGRLSTKRTFRTLSETARHRSFEGTYYFGGKKGKLLMKKGWITVGGNRYYLDRSGKRSENCWRSGYYLLSNGKIARSRQVPDGSWVGEDGRKCKKSEVALGGLKKKLNATIHGYRGSWSVYVKNLKTGDVLNINNRSMYPASTIKAFVMATVYDQISKGKLQETGTVQRLLRSMITVSDNESFNALVRILGSGSFLSGAKVVNHYLKKNGYTGTGCHHTLHPAGSSRTSDGRSNSSSAKDCGVLLTRIYRGKCVSKKYSAKMLSLLKQQERRWKIPSGLPSGVRSANKTGETNSTQHDIAIVFGKKVDYVLCVFTSGCGEGSACSGIRRISRQVYDYLN